MIYDIWRLSTEKNGFGGAAFLNIPFHACIDIQKVCNIWYIYLHMIFGSRLTRQAVDHGSLVAVIPITSLLMKAIGTDQALF